MIARLGPTNILHRHGCSILANISTNKFSWFTQVNELCQQYSLPGPLQVLNNPPSKESFKKKAKLLVLDWWNTKFREDILRLPSLQFFRADFMSLATTHPIWTSAGSSPYEIRKATVQARMLSGRYRTYWLRRHWSGDSTGACLIPGCSGMPGTLLHIATGECPGLVQAYSHAADLWNSFLSENPNLLPIIQQFQLDKTEFLSFLLDPSTQPSVVIALAQQTEGNIIVDQLRYLTRTCLFIIHKERLKLMKL